MRTFCCCLTLSMWQVIQSSVPRLLPWESPSPALFLRFPPTARVRLGASLQLNRHDCYTPTRQPSHWGSEHHLKDIPFFFLHYCGPGEMVDVWVKWRVDILGINLELHVRQQPPSHLAQAPHVCQQPPYHLAQAPLKSFQNSARSQARWRLPLIPVLGNQRQADF